MNDLIDLGWFLKILIFSGIEFQAKAIVYCMDCCSSLFLAIGGRILVVLRIG